jgi:hypothetical protein
MKTQVALRLDAGLVRVAKSRADRENRSLANFVETVLSEALITPDGDDTPILSMVHDRLDGIVAVDDDGKADPKETKRLRHLIAIAAKGRPR